MELTKAEQRNVTIDLWKFIYCWFIVFFHFYNDPRIHFIGGRYSVDFFLLTAGLFFFQGLEKNPDMPPHKRIAKRFWRLFPWSLTAFIFTFIVIRVVINGASAVTLIKGMSSYIWEVLLVKMNGLNQGSALLNVPAWTISSMLLTEIVMVGLFATHKKTFIHVILPVTLILGFGFWCNYGATSMPDWTGFTAFGTLRAWLVYGCAYYCLRAGEYLRDVNFNRRGELCLTVLETLCHVFAVAAMLFTASKYFLWCTLAAFFVAIAISMSGHSLWNRALRKLSGLTGRLGAFSLSIYLTHWPVRRYFEYLYPDSGERYSRVFLFIAAVLICSLAHCFITDGLIKLWRKNRQKIGAWFIGPQKKEI